jgi:hypothetical protein
MMLATLIQRTADRPIAHHGWNSSWWVWIIIGFIVLVGILSFSGRNKPRTRV